MRCDERWSEWWDATGRDELAGLLLREWDVIGVTPFETEARGEYTPEAMNLVGARLDETGLRGWMRAIARFGESRRQRRVIPGGAD